MKIFVISDKGYYMKPDSALLAGGKPFFLPNDMGVIKAQQCLVVRICRLGKGIPERFAHRYWKEITMGLNVIAADLLNTFISKGEPYEPATCFDGSAIIGVQWKPKEENQEVDKHISLLSRTHTLKTGDLLFIPRSKFSELQIEQHIEAQLCGDTVLNMYVR